MYITKMTSGRETTQKVSVHVSCAHILKYVPHMWAGSTLQTIKCSRRYGTGGVNVHMYTFKYMYIGPLTAYLYHSALIMNCTVPIYPNIYNPFHLLHAYT